MSKIQLRGMMVLFVAICLVVSVGTALAHRLDVTVKDSAGNPVTSTTPYSPKMTCGGCHFKCSDSTYSTDKSTWCDGTTGKEQKSCVTNSDCPDYESAARSEVSKQQGVLNADGTFSTVTYTVTVPLHGASVGKHSTEGRNEGVTTAMRSVWGAPAFISAPGMYGRF